MKDQNPHISEGAFLTRKRAHFSRASAKEFSLGGQLGMSIRLQFVIAKMNMGWKKRFSTHAYTCSVCGSRIQRNERDRELQVEMEEARRLHAGMQGDWRFQVKRRWMAPGGSNSMLGWRISVAL